jgi:hypothetical protein
MTDRAAGRAALKLQSEREFDHKSLILKTRIVFDEI